MASRRKLQIFVSSTFTDLIDERQAAVEAILTAGHIPAGMELFTAGSEEQMKVIYRWIDESDAYMLLIGGRYGSVETSTGKSYTQLEYEYAIKTNKPAFSLVLHESFIDEKTTRQGRAIVLENTNNHKLKKLIGVVTKNMIKFPQNIDQIKLYTRESISEIERMPNLSGWIRATEDTNSKEISEQLARLISENEQLKRQLDASLDANLGENFNGLNYKEVVNLLNRNFVDVNIYAPEGKQLLNVSKAAFNKSVPHITHLDYFWIWYLTNATGHHAPWTSIQEEIFEQLLEIGFIKLIRVIQDKNGKSVSLHEITATGRAFCLKVKVNNNVSALLNYVKNFRSEKKPLFLV